MPAGIKVWNEKGKLTLDTTDRITTFFGVFDTNDSDGSGVDENGYIYYYKDFPQLDEGMHLWAFVASYPYGYTYFVLPKITSAGNRLILTFPTTDTDDCCMRFTYFCGGY